MRSVSDYQSVVGVVPGQGYFEIWLLLSDPQDEEDDREADSQGYINVTSWSQSTYAICLICRQCRTYASTIAKIIATHLDKYHKGADWEPNGPKQGTRGIERGTNFESVIRALESECPDERDSGQAELEVAASACRVTNLDHYNNV